MDRRINDSVGGSSHLFVQENWRSFRTEGAGKASLQSNSVGRSLSVSPGKHFMDRCLSFNVDGMRSCTHYYNIMYKCIHRCETPTIDIYSKSPSMTDESNSF